MKQLIVFILAIELVLSPLNLSLGFHNSYATEQDCGAGRSWSSTLNRCIIQTEVINTKAEAHECDGLEGDDYQKCFQKNVEDKLTKAENKGEIGAQTTVTDDYNDTLIPTVMTLGTAYVMFKNKHGLQGCGSASAWMMLGAGVGTLLGEFMAQQSYGDDLDGLVKKYKDKMASSSEDEAENLEAISTNQTLAFDFQIEQENSRRKAHQKRKEVYDIASKVYTGAVLAAVYEQFAYAYGQDSTCKDITKEGDAADKKPNTDANSEVASQSKANPAADGANKATDAQTASSAASKAGKSSEVAKKAAPKSSTITGNETDGYTVVDQNNQTHKFKDKDEVLLHVRDQDNTHFNNVADKARSEGITDVENYKGCTAGQFNKQAYINEILSFIGYGDYLSDYCAPQSTKVDTFNYDPFKSVFPEYHYIENLTATEKLEIVFRKIANIFPSAHAQGIERIEVVGERLDLIAPDKIEIEKPKIDLGKFEAPKLNKPEVAESTSIGDTIANALRTPWVRAALSGALAMYTKKIADKAEELEKVAKGRVKLLKDLKDGFKTTGGASFAICSSDDRKNPAKINCYCYLDNGTKNPQREKSGTCQAHWKSNDFSLAAGDYDRAQGYSQNSIKGCLKNNGLYSQNCCSKASEQGQCFKMSGKLQLGQLGGLTGLTDTMKSNYKYVNGNISTGQLDSNSANKMALKATKILKKMEKDPKKAPMLKKVKNLQNKMQRSFAKRIMAGVKNGQINPSSFGALSGGSSTNVNSPKEVLNNMKKEFKNHNKLKAGKGGLARGSKKSDMDDFDFSDGGKGGIEIDNSVNDIMAKNYKINDISENSHHDIFKIISNRYQRSGLRRLFDEKGISEAEAANDTDINER